MKEKRQTAIVQLIKDPKSILGVIISLAGIYWALKDFHYINFKESIQQINLIYLVLAVFFLWGSVWLRGMRWKCLFQDDNSPSITSLYKAELIGYFGNNVLPLRLGELLRSYIVGNEYSLSKSFVFGTVILERLMDTLTLALFALLVILTYPLEGDLKENIMLIGIISFIGITILFFVLTRININQTENRILIIIKKIIDGLLSIRKEKVIPVIMSSI